MFTLAISCLTTSNLPWFMDLTLQVPIQYCSLQHQTLYLSSVPLTTECCFCFGSIPSFFLEFFLHWTTVAYWAPTDLGSSSFSVLYFCLFILFMEFSSQEYWSGFIFPSPVDHILLVVGGWTSWNKDCQEKYQKPQICRWHHPYGREWRGTKEPLDESERGEWKSWLKAQHSDN